MTGFRSDIQALRGWAVSIVVIDHFQLGAFPSGFLGVDIFFVISGFLITGIILRQIEDGTFSFRDFYYRRAKRLLPAAYVTIAATVIASQWFLGSVETADLTAQVLGALTFSINFVLYFQTDYFGVEAAFKPLLHMWSLAIEEQFYLLFPLLLFFTPLRSTKLIIGLMIALSLSLCAFSQDPSAAFYLLHTRAWELGLGALGAVIAKEMKGPVLPGYLLLPAIAALIAIPALPVIGVHPGISAIMICTATLVIILQKSNKLERSPLIKPLALVGHISYSLYLVHWPVAAFVNNAYIGNQPASLRWACLALSLVLACALYHFIERPFRASRIQFSARVAAVAVSITAMIAGGQSFAVARSSAEDFAELRKPNYGLDQSCDGAILYKNKKCQTGPSPKILIWGDSFAMHLVNGIAAKTSMPVVQSTLSMCAPIIGVALFRPYVPSPQKWGRKCLSFNAETMKRVVKDQSIQTVVLSSIFRNYSVSVEMWQGTGKNNPARVTVSPEQIAERLSDTVAALVKANKRVVIVGPPPSLGTQDFSVCVERQVTGKVILGKTDCNIPRADANQFDTETMKFLNLVKQIDGAEYVSLFDVLCDSERCSTEIDGISIYRDTGHLSSLGSIEVMKRVSVF